MKHRDEKTGEGQFTSEYASHRLGPFGDIGERRLRLTNAHGGKQKAEEHLQAYVRLLPYMQAS